MSMRGKDGRYGTYQDYEVGEEVDVYHPPERRGGKHPKGKNGVISKITEEGTMVLEDGRAFDCAGNGIGAEEGRYILAPVHCGRS